MLAPGKCPDEPGGPCDRVGVGALWPRPGPVGRPSRESQEYLRAPGPGSGLPRLGGRPFGPGPHRAARAPAPATAPQLPRAVPREAPSPLRGRPR